MGTSYRDDNPEQPYLLPPPHDWLPENHLAYFTSSTPNQLDLSALHTAASSPGTPEVMLKRLVYAYATDY